MANKSTYVEGNSRTFKAGADLSTKQFYIVKNDTTVDNSVVLASAATDFQIGILMNAPKSGDSADVYLLNAAGSCKVVAGGSISIGDFLTSDNAGKAVATTSDEDAPIGRAIHAASAGDIVEFLPGGYSELS